MAGVKINKIRLSRYFMNFANTHFLETFVSFLFHYRPQHEFIMRISIFCHDIENFVSGVYIEYNLQISRKSVNLKKVQSRIHGGLLPLIEGCISIKFYIVH